jgi:hypothetical protein
MNTAQGSLTMLNLHTAEPQVYWNGQLVSVVGVAVVNDPAKQTVTIKVQEDPVLAEMAAAGIRIVRV